MQPITSVKNVLCSALNALQWQSAPTASPTIQLPMAAAREYASLLVSSARLKADVRGVWRGIHFSKVSANKTWTVGINGLARRVLCLTDCRVHPVSSVESATVSRVMNRIPAVCVERDMRVRATSASPVLRDVASAHHPLIVMNVPMAITKWKKEGSA